MPRRSASSSDQEAFVSQFSDFAHDLSRVTGIDASVILGQASLESNWGLNAPGNNMFGVKGAYEGKTQRLSTKEMINGRLHSVKENFRAYPDKLTSFKDWSKVISGKAYEGVRKGRTVEEQVAALAASPYATDDDTRYAKGLMSRISAITASPAFQEARKNFQSDLVNDEVGVPDLPGDLYGLNSPQVDVPAPDLPGPLSGLNAPDYSDITQGIPAFDGYTPPDYSGLTRDLAGFDPLANLGSVPSTPDIMGQFAGPTYPDITNSLYGNYNAPDVPGAPDPMSTMDGPTYPDMSAGLYDGAAPASDVSVPSPPDVGGLYGLDSYGPAMSEAGYASPSHTGFDAGSFQTPDFDAPTQQARDRIANFESRNFVGLGAPDFDKMARDLTAEITGKPSFETVSAPEKYTSMETRTREVPFSAPNSLQDAVMGDWEDKFGPAKPAMASKPQTRIETYQQPVEKTRMVQHQVPVAPRALPSQEMYQEAINDQHPRATPSGLGATFGSFDNFLGAMNAHDPRAMGAINDAGMGYAANYAMGDGPYATMGTNDLQDKFGNQFGMDARKGLAEGFKQDYGQISPMGRGVIEGGLKGLATGGPLGMLGGAAFGGLSGYMAPNGWGSMLGSMFDGTFGGGVEMGLAGNMSNYGTPYDGAGIATSHDVNFDGGSREAAMRAEAEALQNGTFGGGPPSSGGGWGNDPSQDGGSRYSGW